MAPKQALPITCQKDRPVVVRRRPGDRIRVRTRLGRRLAGPEPLESRCLLSAAVDTADTPETFYGGYLTVSGIYGRLDELAATYPTITELIDYGDSYSKTVGGTVAPGGQELAGYDLWALKITNEVIAGPKPVFVLMAGIHCAGDCDPRNRPATGRMVDPELRPGRGCDLAGQPA